MVDNLIHKNRKSFLNEFMITKTEFVSMKLHFRYHSHLFIKKGGSVFDGCEYCQERLVSGNDKAPDGYEKMK
jgi:hypothetical protein